MASSYNVFWGPIFKDAAITRLVNSLTETNLKRFSVPSGPSLGAGNVDSARQNLSASFVNGLVNAAFGKDKLLSEDANAWFYKNKEHGMNDGSLVTYERKRERERERERERCLVLNWNFLFFSWFNLLSFKKMMRQKKDVTSHKQRLRWYKKLLFLVALVFASQRFGTIFHLYSLKIQIRVETWISYIPNITFSVFKKLLKTELFQHWT